MDKELEITEVATQLMVPGTVGGLLGEHRLLGGTGSLAKLWTSIYFLEIRYP